MIKTRGPPWGGADERRDRGDLHLTIVQLPGMGGIFRLAPPLTISEDDLHAGVDILAESIRAVGIPR